MRVAILSDIHDNVWNLQRALDWISGNDIEAVILCGDLCSPFVLGMVQNAFPGPIHLVFGNNDGDTFRTTRLAKPQVVIHGELAELTWKPGETQLKSGWSEEGVRLAVNHFNHIATGLVASTRYDVVIYGHDHKHRIAYYDRHLCKYLNAPNANTTLVINPGALMGFDPLPTPAGKHFITPTFVTLDLELMEIRTIEV